MWLLAGLGSHSVCPLNTQGTSAALPGWFWLIGWDRSSRSQLGRGVAGGGGGGVAGSQGGI